MSEQPPGTPPPPDPPGGFPPPSGPPSGPPPGPPSGPPPGLPLGGRPSGPPPVYQPPAYTGQVVGAVPQSQKSVLALVLGILSCVCCPILGPVAFFIGRQAMAEVDGSNGTLSGRGLAQAGFILGIIGSAFLVLAILYWVVVIMILGAAFTTHVNTVTP